MTIKIYEYAGCSTCKKALKFLEAKKIPFEKIDITEAPPSPAEADSVLSALSTRVPDLAARRAPTVAERDSASKEAMLKIRQSGRILLVPPDNSGGMITAPLPFLSRGPSRAARARDERALDEGRARLRRLQARVDSIRRAHDSLRQQPRTP